MIEALRRGVQDDMLGDARGPRPEFGVPLTVLSPDPNRWSYV
jgi:hypothetical protein